MSKLYNIAFKGEVAEGFDVGEVRASFSERFRKTDEVIEQLFSGTAITLAKDYTHKRDQKGPFCPSREKGDTLFRRHG